MSSLYNRLKLYARENGSLLTLFAAVAPFVLSLLFLIALAQGNTQIVGYLVSRLGLVDVWIIGVLGLVISALQIAVMSALLYIVENHSKLEEWKLWTTSILTTIACTVIPVAVIIGGIVGGLTRFFVLRYDRKKKTAHLKKTQQSARGLFVYFIILSVAFSITTYPQLPQTNYTIGDKTVTGKEITHDDMTTLIIEKDSNQLELIINNKITKKEICITASKSWSSKTIFELILNKKRVKSCE